MALREGGRGGFEGGRGGFEGGRGGFEGGRGGEVALRERGGFEGGRGGFEGGRGGGREVALRGGGGFEGGKGAWEALGRELWPPVLEGSQQAQFWWIHPKKEARQNVGGDFGVGYGP